MAFQQFNHNVGAVRTTGASADSCKITDFTGTVATSTADSVGARSAFADLFDTDRLAGIEAVIGADSVKELFVLFERELIKVPGAIAKLLRSDRLSEARLPLHDLKGAALNIGAVTLGNHIRRLEQACRAGQVAEADIDELLRLTDATVAAMGLHGRYDRR
jgi:HPt (histidine-containing phosphotransfer) domain-containing protein